MTIHEISCQLYHLTRGHINGEVFTKTQLEASIRRWMRNPEQLKIKNRFVLEGQLPDGCWLITIDKFADAADGYDYTIPDTREQEEALRGRLFA